MIDDTTQKSNAYPELAAAKAEQTKLVAAWKMTQEENAYLRGELAEAKAELIAALRERAESLQSALTEAEGRIREECAKVCDQRFDAYTKDGGKSSGVFAMEAWNCAAEIRALAVSEPHTERPAGEKTRGIGRAVT